MSVVTLGVLPCDQWLAVLDASHLPWWQVQQERLRTQVARERYEESSRKLMSSWLLVVCNKGMVRLAERLPCVKWQMGPYWFSPGKQELGFWAPRNRLNKWIRGGEIIVLTERQWLAGERKYHHSSVARSMRYWLVYRQGGEGYSLYSLNGKEVWRVVGERWGRRVPYGYSESHPVEESKEVG